MTSGVEGASNTRQHGQDNTLMTAFTCTRAGTAVHIQSAHYAVWYGTRKG